MDLFLGPDLIQKLPLHLGAEFGQAQSRRLPHRLLVTCEGVSSLHARNDRRSSREEAPLPYPGLEEASLACFGSYTFALRVVSGSVARHRDNVSHLRLRNLRQSSCAAVRRIAR